jgi:diguanylate cyclase (GGDEF)-like protein
MLKFMRTVVWSSNRLPKTIFAEFVAIIFTSLPPVTLIGVTLTAVGILVAAKQHDLVVWGLVALGIAVTTGRILLILAYRRKAKLEGVQNPELWDRRYAIGAYCFALVLGALNLRAIIGGDPMIAMLITSVMFGYGAGIVARLAVRPRACIISLGLAVVPTGVGYLIYAAKAADYYVSVMYVSQALLLLAFAAAGTEAMAHIYRTTLQQLLTRQDLTMLAGQDALTGLPNRTLLRARLNEGIVQTRRNDTLLAFHCLDLDHFKWVNDNLGHPAGDGLLKLVAERLASISRIDDTVARIGGDEFVVLQIGIRHEDEAHFLAHRIVRALSAPFAIGGRDVHIGVTIGIALAPRDGVSLDRLISCADAALYQAKHKARGSIAFAGDHSSESAATAA